jgi:hypothetical protein
MKPALNLFYINLKPAWKAGALALAGLPGSLRSFDAKAEMSQ